jgi:hypothetical protein
VTSDEQNGRAKRSSCSHEWRVTSDEQNGRATGDEEMPQAVARASRPWKNHGQARPERSERDAHATIANGQGAHTLQGCRRQWHGSLARVRIMGRPALSEANGMPMPQLPMPQELKHMGRMPMPQ